MLPNKPQIIVATKVQRLPSAAPGQNVALLLHRNKQASAISCVVPHLFIGAMATATFRTSALPGSPTVMGMLHKLSAVTVVKRVENSQDRSGTQAVDARMLSFEYYRPFISYVHQSLVFKKDLHQWHRFLSLR